MWNIGTLSFIAGLILLFIALVGGGIKVKEIEVPKVGSIIRVFSGIFGIVLLLVGIGIYYDKESTDITDNSPENEITTQVEKPETKTFCAKCSVWNFTWLDGNTQYEGLLVFNPESGYGKLRVKYFDGTKNNIIQEEMNQVSTNQGQYLEGKNPFDAETATPVSNYVPDNLIMNNDQIIVFDANLQHETTMIEIKDVDASLKVFGFANEDIDF